MKIGDLGFGRQMRHEESFVMSGVGTPLYQSPELCAGKPYNEKSDIWALGCLVYEMATGEPPFSARTHLKLIGERSRAQSGDCSITSFRY